MTIGHEDAPVQIENFTDFQCPFCAEAHGILVTLARRYPASVRLRHRDYPLDTSCNHQVKLAFHPKACQAAYFARCAAEQGSFWPFAARVFRDQMGLGKDDLLHQARELRLDTEALVVCVDHPTTRRAVFDDIEDGVGRKVTGTPTAFISLRGRSAERIVGKRTPEWWDRKVGTLIDRWHRSRPPGQKGPRRPAPGAAPPP